MAWSVMEDRDISSPAVASVEDASPPALNDPQVPASTPQSSTSAASASVATIPIPDAISNILSGDVARVASGAASIKHIALKDEGEAACVAAGACDAVAKRLAVEDTAANVMELSKALINTASSASGFAAHLQAGSAASLVRQLATGNLTAECLQVVCKAVQVLSFDRENGQVALVDAGVAPALVSHLKRNADSITLARVIQAIASVACSNEACKIAFIRCDFAAAAVPHLTPAAGRDCLVPLIASIARISTNADGKRALLAANIAPAIVGLIIASDDDVCTLVACTAARLAVLDEADDALSKAGIAAAIITRFEAKSKSQDLFTELAKIIGNIASNIQYNNEYCCPGITLPLVHSISEPAVIPHVARQALRAISAIASVDGKPSPQGQNALLQADAPMLLTKMLHICTDNAVVLEIVRAMRVCAHDCSDARVVMQAVGAMTALVHQLERQVDIKIAAEIYSSAQVILQGGQPLSLAPAPVDNRTLLQKLLCYPNRVKVEAPPDDSKWNIEAGLPSVNPRLAAVRDAAHKADASWKQPLHLKPDEVLSQWGSLRDTGMRVLSKSAEKVQVLGVLMSRRLREAVIYVTLAVLVTLYAVLLLDSDSAYFLKRGLQTQFEAPFPCTNVSNYAKTFYDIQDGDDIFMWLQGVVLPLVYSGSSNQRPQCMCQTEEFITCSGPHAASNSDIVSSKTLFTLNATSNQYESRSVPVSKRGLPFLAEAVCSDEGAAGNAAISYTVSSVRTVVGKSRFFTSGKHFLRIGDPFRWVAPNTSNVPPFISQHIGRTLYVREADGSNSTTFGFWFEASLSPLCLTSPCPPTEFPTTAINLAVPALGYSFVNQGDVPPLTLYLDRPCRPETPCMSECGKRECACNEAHGYSNISKLNEMPSATAGPLGGSNILILPPRIRMSVVKPAAACSYPTTLLDGFSDGVCWPEFSSDSVQKNGDAFLNSYTAAFGPPSAKALKWLTYSDPVGSTFLPSNTDLLRFYGSGGYILDIPLDDFEAARRMLHEAKTIGWWNRNSTRALSLEFAFYNPNVNRFITVQYLLESSYSSGIIHGVQFRHSTLTPWSRPYNFAGLIILYIIFAINIAVILHLYATYKSAGSDAFWSEGFMIINVIISVLILVAMCISIFVLVETARVILLDASTMDHHVVYELLYWNGQVGNLFTVVAWLIWIRVVEFLDMFSPKTKILQKVLVRSSADIAVFSSVFVVYLMGFAISRVVAMGSVHQGFRTLNSALNNQLMEIFVSYDYVAFRDANPVMGPLYFVIFTLVIILLMVNMLAAIVERFVGLCKEESDATKNSSDQDISDYSRRLLRMKVQQVLNKTPGSAAVQDSWLEMWATEGALFQNAGIMDLQQLISAADLNSDGHMSMEEFLEFVRKNAQANEEAMFQENSQDHVDFLLSKIRVRYDEIEAEQQRLALLLQSKVAAV